MCDLKLSPSIVLIYLDGFIDLNVHVCLVYFVFDEFILQIYDYWENKSWLRKFEWVVCKNRLVEKMLLCNLFVFFNKITVNGDPWFNYICCCLKWHNQLQHPSNFFQ